MGIIPSVLFVGFLFGSLISGFLGDKFGRKIPIILGCFLLFISIIFAIISPNFYSVVISFAIFGLGNGIQAPINSTLFLEILPISMRGKMTTLFIGVSFCLGEFFGLFICFIFTNESGKNGDWKKILGTNILVFFISLLFIVFYVEESPRFLLLTGKFDKGIYIIDKIIKKNQGKHTRLLTEEEISGLRKWVEINQNFKEDSEGNKVIIFGSISDLFGKNLMLKTLKIWVIWFTLSFVYYGSIFELPSILSKISGFNKENAMNKKKEYLNLFISIVSESISCPVSFMLIENKYLGRRRSNFIFFALGGIFSLSAFIFKEKFFSFNSSVLRFFISCCFILCYPFTGEIYPTQVRAIGMGIAGAISRLGGISAPWFNLLGSNISLTGSYFIYSLFCFASSIATFKLEETAGKEIDSKN